jgi:hypothetical protein
MYDIVKGNAYDLYQFYKTYPYMVNATGILDEVISLIYQEAITQNTSEGWNCFLEHMKQLSEYEKELDQIENESNLKPVRSRTNEITIIESYIVSAEEYIFSLKEEDEMVWTFVQSKNTTEYYKRYLENFPQGKYIIECKRRIEEMAWDFVQSEKTIAACEKYIADFPKGKHVRECKKLMEEMAWYFVQSGKTIAACEKYIADFPKGKHIRECKKLLIDLETDEIFSSGKYDQLPPMEKTKMNASSVQSGYTLIEITNDTEYEMTIRYSGKVESKKFVFAPQKTQTIRLLNGHYRIAASVNAPNVGDYAGEETLKGDSYEVEYYISSKFPRIRRPKIKFDLP